MYRRLVIGSIPILLANPVRVKGHYLREIANMAREKSQYGSSPFFSETLQCRCSTVYRYVMLGSNSQVLV